MAYYAADLFLAYSWFVSSFARIITMKLHKFITGMKLNPILDHNRHAVPL